MGVGREEREGGDVLQGNPLLVLVGFQGRRRAGRPELALLPLLFLLLFVVKVGEQALEFVGGWGREGWVIGQRGGWDGVVGGCMDAYIPPFLSLWASGLLAWGTWLSSPLPGCLCVLWCAWVGGPVRDGCVAWKKGGGRGGHGIAPLLAHAGE